MRSGCAGRGWRRCCTLTKPDQVKDAARLKATSPIAQAARIKQAERIEYAEEGHGWSLAANRVDFWGRVEKFLDKHIDSGVTKL